MMAEIRNLLENCESNRRTQTIVSLIFEVAKLKVGVDLR